LVERLRAQDGEPHDHDLVAALVRLHPDGRDEALEQLDSNATLDGPLGHVIRYALGAAPPSKAELEPIGSWIAASRSRLPLDDDEWLLARGVRGAGRSQPIDARVAFQSQAYTWNDRGGEHHSSYWKWSVAVGAPAEVLLEQEPTAVAGGERSPLGQADLEDLVGWLALVYPHDCEHFLVTTVDSVIRTATSTEVSHDAVRVLDAIARHPGRLGPLALTTLGAGLSASKADQRAHAVDAVLHLHRAGRLDAAALAQGIVAMRGPGLPTRLAATMRDIATADALGRDLAIDALTIALPSYEVDDRGLHALLELLREELLRAGRPTPGPLVAWLRQLKGTSRAAKAAAALAAGGPA
jgi:hypothetical protein